MFLSSLYWHRATGFKCLYTEAVWSFIRIVLAGCREVQNFLVCASATDKQMTHLIWGVIVQPVMLSLPLSLSLPPYKASLAGPHPQTGHRWNAAPGILPQLAGRGAAAGWNMIRPLSKHAFHYGCVQGRAHSGNTSDRGKVLPGLCCGHGIPPLGWFITSDYINPRIAYSFCVIAADNDSFIFIITSQPWLFPSYASTLFTQCFF